jgi:hypothetical protein
MQQPAQPQAAAAAGAASPVAGIYAASHIHTCAVLASRVTGRAFKRTPILGQGQQPHLASLVGPDSLVDGAVSW